MSASLYEELGVEREADVEVIKAAYRRRTKATHPDRGGCREEFQRVQRAYDVLSDPERRRHYDETGDDGCANGGRTEEEEARAALVQIFLEAIEQVQPEDDLVRVMCGVIEKAGRGLAGALERSKGTQKRLENILGRLSENGAQIFRDVLSSKIGDEVKRQANLARALRVGERMEDLLEQVAYRAGGGDRAPQMEELLLGLQREAGRRRRNGAKAGGIFG